MFKTSEIKIEYPLISSYLTIASLTGVLWSHKECTLPWLVDHFIQLYTRIPKEQTKPELIYGKKWAGFYDFVSFDSNFITYDCPFVVIDKLDRTILNILSFSAFAESKIEQGYYLEVLLDNFYISVSPGYHNNHFWHQTLIYGYESKTRELLIADFYDNHKFIFTKISYDEADKAYNACMSEINNASALWKKLLFVTKYVDTQYSFDLELLKSSYYDYLGSQDSSHKHDKELSKYEVKIALGLEYYDSLSEYVEWAGCTQEDVDRKAFHVLCDHKKILELRLKYLIYNNLLKENEVEWLLTACEEIISDSLLLQNLVLKYNMTHNKKTLDKVKCRIIQLKQFDSLYVEKLLLALK